MPLLRRQREFDRNRILAEAARARLKKRRRRAIALYRRILAVEPRNVEMHEKLAPLLAETGQSFDAWMSFRLTAHACLRAGKVDRALNVYREAARHLPHEVRTWDAIAHLLKQRGRGEAAVETLREGSRQFRSRCLRPQAIYLLRRAREIAPWDLETVLELVRLLAGAEQREEARILLRELVARVEGTPLRRVRGAQFRVDPGLRPAWRWLRAALGSDREAAVRPSEVVYLHAVRR